MKSYDSIVSRAETEALKEMIFKRVRERAENLAKETQKDYTSAVQNDIMEIAHNSFANTKNPFSELSAYNEIKNQQMAPQKESNDSIGFEPRKVNTIKEKFNNDNNYAKKQAENGEINNNMHEARASFENKKTFMGALDFLNSQASASLLNAKKHGFEAVA